MLVKISFLSFLLSVARDYLFLVWVWKCTLRTFVVMGVCSFKRASFEFVVFVVLAGMELL